MTLRLIAVLLSGLLAGCEPAAVSESAGFAGLGQRVEGFSEVRPGRSFAFPADHGAHPDYRIEWWYVTANLTDEDGQEWGAQWTLFRQALEPEGEEQAQAGWDSAQVWLGHAAVTRAEGHRHTDRLARGGVGQAGVTPEPFQAWIDDWMFEGSGQHLERAQVRAQGEGFGYRLELRSDRPLVYHGEQGYSRKSAGDQASYYYSQPFYQATGEIHWGGRRYAVQGQAWLDREWSSQPLAADQQGWDWFSLHLDEGQKVMLFRLRSKGDDFFSGSWISADGEQRALAPAQIRMQPLGETRVAGRQVPTRWRLEVPDLGLAVSVSAMNEQAWMGTGIPYWEGPVRIEGSHRGRGYLEMTGY